MNEHHEPWVIGHRVKSRASILSDDFFEVCAEIARRNKVLPTVFYNVVLDNNLCPPASLGTPRMNLTLQAGAYTLACLLNDTRNNHQEACNRFALWAVEYKAKHHAHLLATNTDTASNNESNAAATYPEHGAPTTNTTSFEGSEALLADYAGLAEIAVNTAAYPQLERNVLISIVKYRDILHEHTPLLPHGVYRKETMLVPMNIPAMLGRLEQLSKASPVAYEGIHTRFRNTFACPIVTLNSDNHAQNMAAVAIDLAMMMHVHQCDIEEALCAFSRLDKSMALDFAHQVLKTSQDLAQGYRCPSGNGWG